MSSGEDEVFTMFGYMRQEEEAEEKKKTRKRKVAKRKTPETFNWEGLEFPGDGIPWNEIFKKLKK